MINVPPKIYLNIGAKGMADDFKKLCEVTWCKDKIHEDDIEYTLTPTPIDSKEGAEEYFDKHKMTIAGVDYLDEEDFIKYFSPKQ